MENCALRHSISKQRTLLILCMGFGKYVKNEWAIRSKSVQDLNDPLASIIQDCGSHQLVDFQSVEQSLVVGQFKFSLAIWEGFK